MPLFCGGACMRCIICYQQNADRGSWLIILQSKSLLNVVYFGFDHVVWASQSGIYTNKEVGGLIRGVLTLDNHVIAPATSQPVLLPINFPCVHIDNCD